MKTICDFTGGLCAGSGHSLARSSDFKTQDIMCQLVSFRGARWWILLPLDKAKQAVSQSLC